MAVDDQRNLTNTSSCSPRPRTTTTTCWPRRNQPSPIILPDFPSVAAESRGDFFDGAEIDQLLVLSVLSLTDEEQRQMCETDPRAREILNRCRGLSPDQMLRLHGVTRERPFAEVRP